MAAQAEVVRLKASAAMLSRQHASYQADVDKLQAELQQTREAINQASYAHCCVVLLCCMLTCS